MLKKIAIKNNYHKKLSFESLLGRAFSMEGKEIRTVDYEMAIILLKNVWVERVDKDFDRVEKEIKKIEPMTEKKEYDYKSKQKTEMNVKKTLMNKNKGRGTIVKN